MLCFGNIFLDKLLLAKFQKCYTIPFTRFRSLGPTDVSDTHIKMERDCKYCGRKTQYWEVVKQIPTSACPQDFIYNHITGIDGKLSPDDYICTEYEACFNLKYSSLQRGLSFAQVYQQKQYKYKSIVCPLSCSKCGSTSSIRF